MLSEPARNPSDYYTSGRFVATTGFSPGMRLAIDAYESFKRTHEEPLKILDVGCGGYALISDHVNPVDSYTGCDIVPAIEKDLPFFSIDLNNESLRDRVGDSRFDVIFCLELVEHIFSPDCLLRDLKALLKPDGMLILSTPNLAYWLNRVLLIAGISPLLAENSAEVKLGRQFKMLGQGNPTEGHLRVFTYKAMLELMERCDLKVTSARGCEVWNFFPDKVLARISPRIAPDIVYTAT